MLLLVYDWIIYFYFIFSLVFLKWYRISKIHTSTYCSVLYILFFERSSLTNNTVGIPCRVFSTFSQMRVGPDSWPLWLLVMTLKALNLLSDRQCINYLCKCWILVNHISDTSWFFVNVSHVYDLYVSNMKTFTRALYSDGWIQWATYAQTVTRETYRHDKLIIVLIDIHVL